jgi:hypothetical protein
VNSLLAMDCHLVAIGNLCDGYPFGIGMGHQLNSRLEGVGDVSVHSKDISFALDKAPAYRKEDCAVN